MAVDVENVTGHATLASTIDCDKPGGTQAVLPCNAIGGSGNDVIVGTSKGGAIAGNGGNDAVNTNGGNEEVDLAGDGATTTVECVSASTYPTILYTSATVVPSTAFATDCSGATLVAE
jgi:hypothetical protein